MSRQDEVEVVPLPKKGIKRSSAKAKGNRLETKVGSRLGGKRAPLSGAAGGGDVWLPGGSLWADFVFECKKRAKLPGLIDGAMNQAKRETEAAGSKRIPAVVMEADRGEAILCVPFEAMVSWVEGLAEFPRARVLREELVRVETNIRSLRESL